MTGYVDHLLDDDRTVGGIFPDHPDRMGPRSKGRNIHFCLLPDGKIRQSGCFAVDVYFQLKEMVGKRTGRKENGKLDVLA